MCNQKQACIICDKALHYIKYRSMLYESVFIINMYFFFFINIWISKYHNENSDELLISKEMRYYEEII